MNRWYVVHTHAMAEEKAFGHLRRQGFDAYLPRYKKQRRHARRVDEVMRPLFPRYLFVRLDLEAQGWRSISGTVGVSRMICRGDSPASVPEGVVEDIVAREGNDGAIEMVLPNFRKNEALHIDSGPFENCVGFFQEMTDDRRVLLLLELMGRAVKVVLPVNNLAAAV